MAFILEDGTGTVVGANAYISVAEMKAYFSDRVPLSTSTLDTDLEKAIVIATDFIDLTYAGRFLGQKLVVDQPLQWPRTYDSANPLPEVLKNSTAEYANFALTEDLYFRPTYDDSGKSIVRKFEKVGPLEEATDYSDGGGVDFTKKRFPKAERWIQSLLSGGQGGVVR